MIVCSLSATTALRARRSAVTNASTNSRSRREPVVSIRSWMHAAVSSMNASIKGLASVARETNRRAITGVLLEPVGEVLGTHHGKRAARLKHRAETVGTAYLLAKSKTRCRVGAVHHPQQSGIAHPPHRDPSVPVGEQHRSCRSVQPVGEPIEHWPSRDMQRVLAVNLGAERQRWDVRLGSEQRRPAPRGENFRPHRRWALVATQERGTSAQYVACLMHESTFHCDPCLPGRWRAGWPSSPSSAADVRIANACTLSERQHPPSRGRCQEARGEGV